MTNSQRSYFEILNVSPHASDADVKRAYHKLAMKYHPDRNPQNRFRAMRAFQQLSEAYAAIKTQEKRAVYYKSLRAGNDNGGAWISELVSVFWPKKDTAS